MMAFLFRGDSLDLALDEILEKHLINLAFVITTCRMANQFREIQHDLLSEII